MTAQITTRGANPKTRTRVLFALAIASVLAVLTAVLLLSGNVSVAIWMEGPYFPLTLLLPGSVDTLPTMVAVVAAYYFVASLVALKYSSRRAVVLVVSIVIAVNTLGAFAWHRQACRSASPDGRIAQLASAADVTALSLGLHAPSAAALAPAPAAADTRDVRCVRGDGGGADIER
jgi:hypothetical protein